MKATYLILIIFVFSLASLPIMVSAVSCGDTITSDTVLTNDLLDCSTNGITIAADNVMLDCNGHMIDGTKTPNTRGVFVNGSSGFTVKNCLIREFGNGIFFYSDHYTIINNIVVNNTGNGMSYWIPEPLPIMPINQSNNLKASNKLIRSESILPEICVDNSQTINVISDNYAIGNNAGINLGMYTEVTRNIIVGNAGTGLLVFSFCNVIYDNYFDNALNANGYASSGDRVYNYWNVSKRPGPNIINGPYIAGNFWNNYAGQDLDNDGIGDTNLPYNSPEGERLIAYIGPELITYIGPDGGDYAPIMQGTFTSTTSTSTSTSTTTSTSTSTSSTSTSVFPTLAITKWGTKAVPGRNSEYTITISNNGQDVSSYGVAELLNQSWLTFISSDQNTIIDRNTSVPVLFWKFSQLQSGQSMTFSSTDKISNSLNLNSMISAGLDCVNSDIDNNLRGCTYIKSPELSGLLSVNQGVVTVFSGEYEGYCAPRGSTYHYAYDFEVDYPTPVKAIYPGTYQGPHDWSYSLDGRQINGGKAVWIISELPDKTKFVTSYGHVEPNSSLIVGQQVNEGDVIATIYDQYYIDNNQGLGTGLLDHLDLSMFWWPATSKAEKAFDFDNYVKGKKTTCTSSSNNAATHLKGVMNTLRTCFVKQANACFELSQTVVGPLDPNEKGVVASQYIRPDQELVYPIHFENIGDVEAINVYVNDTLDDNLDDSTLQILTPGATYDPATRTIAWSLIDRNLQPNETDTLMLSIKPMHGLSSGTVIRNKATIQFDIFQPIITNEVNNTIDNVYPVCNIIKWSSYVSQNEFPIYLQGSDSFGQIDYYDVFVSENGIIYDKLATTKDNQVTFSGEFGKTYKFYCTATDIAGNRESQQSAEASITLLQETPSSPPIRRRKR